MTAPDDFWIVRLHDFHFCVDEATARALTTDLVNGVKEILQFTDLGGAEASVRSADVTGIWQTTTRSRQSDREIEAAHKAESGFDEP